MQSEVAHNIVNIALPVLENYIPAFKDTRIAIATSSLLHGTISGVFTKFTNLFNFNKYNSIKIDTNDKNYFRLQQYILDKHESNILDITVINKKKIIKKLKKTIEIKYKNGKIFIDFEEKNEKENNKQNNLYLHQFINEDYINSIIFSSKLSVLEIKKFVDELIEKTDVFEQNTITIHYTNKIQYERKNDFDIVFHSFDIKTNKELKYVFVSNGVKLNFIDEIKKFLNNEQFYKKRGLPYKTSYLLYGPPGCGKTSIIRAICNEYKLPIFYINMIGLKNHHINSLLFEMRKIIRDAEKYVVLLEDFDRVIESLTLQNYKNNYNYNHNHNKYAQTWELDYESKNSKNELTMDCILNFLDGIDESYGRITIITANNIYSITSNDALCRPGRIDHFIELPTCDESQIKQIIEMYEINLSNIEIDMIAKSSITPAKLINLLNKYNTKDLFMENIHEMQNENDEEEENTEYKQSGKRRGRENIPDLYNYKSTSKIQRNINLFMVKKRKLERYIINLDKKIQCLEKSDVKCDLLDKQIYKCQKEKIIIEIKEIDTKIEEYKVIRKLCVDNEIKCLQEKRKELE